jgi:hypothetical protein
MTKILFIVAIVFVGCAGWGGWKYSEYQQHKRLHDYLLLQQIKKTNQYYGTVAGPQDPVAW